MMNDQEVRAKLYGFYQFLSGVISIYDFEDWIKTHPELQDVLGKTAYLDLISFDYYEKINPEQALKRRLIEIYEMTSPGSLLREYARHLICGYLDKKLELPEYVLEMNNLYYLAQDLIRPEFVFYADEYTSEPAWYMESKLDEDKAKVFSEQYEKQVQDLSQEFYEQHFSGEYFPGKGLIDSTISKALRSYLSENHPLKLPTNPNLSSQNYKKIPLEEFQERNYYPRSTNPEDVFQENPPLQDFIEKFPSICRNPRRIVITSEGNVLLSVSATSEFYGTKSWHTEIMVWECSKEKPRLLHTIPGELVGISKDGKSLITRFVPLDYLKKDEASISGAYRYEISAYTDPPCTFKGWDLHSGKELDTKNISPQAFSLHQRVHITAARYEFNGFKLVDVLTGRVRILLTGDTEGGLISWVMTPNDKFLAITSFYDETDFGSTIDIRTGFSGGISFHPRLVDDTTQVRLYFSLPHNLMISNNEVYDLSSGKLINQFRPSSDSPFRLSGFEAIAVNPIRKNQFAIGHRRSPNAVLLVDAEKMEVSAVFEQEGLIEYLEFFPHGEHLAVLLSDGTINILNVQAN